MLIRSAPGRPGDSPAGRILSTAHDLFYRDGIRATGIDRIIEQARVTKVTFYRQFPSKDALVVAFLNHRHERWMAWFTDALARHAARRARPLEALVPALAEWLDDPGFRGCAFLNSVGELGGTQPEVVAIARGHKHDMVGAIAKLLPPSRRRARDAQALGVAVDGAIVQAQYEGGSRAALAGLRRLVEGIVASGLHPHGASPPPGSSP